jgi:hypothetical protein
MWRTCGGVVNILFIKKIWNTPVILLSHSSSLSLFLSLLSHSSSLSFYRSTVVAGDAEAAVAVDEEVAAAAVTTSSHPSTWGWMEAAAAGSRRAANAMLRTANLYRSLSDAEAARLLGPLYLGSQAVRALMPGDDACLLALTLAEKLDALNRVAAVATRLGRRCMLQALLGFDGSTTSTPTSLLAAPTPP